MTNSKKNCTPVENQNDPEAAAKRFIKDCKWQNLTPQEAVERLISPDVCNESIENWIDAKQVIYQILRERLNGGSDA